MKQYFDAFISRRSAVLAFAGIVIIVVGFYYPLIQGLFSTVIAEDDWYRNYCYAALPRISMLDYQQFPLRTPFLSGGYPSIASPLDSSMSPFYIFILMFGEVIGLRIITFLCFILGAAGMFFLCRRILHYNVIGASFSALVFSLGRWGVYEVVDGNVQKALYYLLPWLYVFYFKAHKSKKYILYSSLLLSTVIMHSANTSIGLFIALFIIACLYAVTWTKPFRVQLRPRYIVIFLQIALLAIALSFIKILPMVQLYGERIGYMHLPYEDSYTRIAAAIKSFGSAVNLKTFSQALLDREFDSYATMYFGLIPILVFLMAIIFNPLKNLRFALALSFFTLLLFGPNSYVDVFKMIWHIHPVMQGIWRLDKYFGFFVAFFIAIISGSFFGLFNKKKFLWVGMLVLIVCTVNMYTCNREVFQKLILHPMPQFKKHDMFSQVYIPEVNVTRAWGGFSEVKDIRAYHPMWSLVRQKTGVANFNWAGNFRIAESTIPAYFLNARKAVEEKVYVDALENLSESRKAWDFLPLARVNPEYRGEIFFQEEGNEVLPRLFTPNKIIVQVQVNKPGQLMINQNYHKSWRTDKGRIANSKGLLSVDLAQSGNYMITLEYVPRDFYMGLIVSALAFMGALFWVFII